MKILFFSLAILLSVKNMFSQSTQKPSRPDILYNRSSNYLSYAGDMNDEIYSYLSEQEIQLYDSCLSYLGLTRENVKWYTSELLDELMSKNCKFSVKSISLKTDPSLNWESFKPGKDKLEKPECLFIVTRIPGKVDEVSIIMYH
ncbi:MAG: hypothetical protein ACKOA1_02145 [Bacteroidota bacterium]